MDDAIRRRIEKLQALAERGVGGEKETAQRKLDKLLKDNNLTLESLESEETYYYLFSYSDDHSKKLLNQVIYKVMGEGDRKIYRSKGKRMKIGLFCTPSQKVEIDLDYEFYKNLFDAEIDSLLTAFIQTQGIFPEDCPITTVDLDSLSPEEREQFMKVRNYQQNIEKRTRSLMVEDKNS